ncbi:hypothetical protein ACWDO7_22770 [Streptomyces sp. NPDC003656]
MMPHKYICPGCRTQSRTYSTQARAQRHGQRHRDDHHGGDHPFGETVQSVPYEIDGAQVRVLAGVLVVLVVALLVKAF